MAVVCAIGILTLAGTSNGTGYLHWNRLLCVFTNLKILLVFVLFILHFLRFLMFAMRLQNPGGLRGIQGPSRTSNDHLGGLASIQPLTPFSLKVLGRRLG